MTYVYESESKRYMINLYTGLLRYLQNNIVNKSIYSNVVISNEMIEVIKDRRSDLCITLKKERI